MTAQHSPDVRRRSSAAGPLTLITGALGGLMLLAVTGSAAAASWAQLSSTHVDASVDPAGLTQLTVDADPSQFTVQFAQTDHATLESSGTVRAGWQLVRADDELIVDSPRRSGDWCVFWCTDLDDQVVLTLPESLNDGGLDAELSLEAGTLSAAGDFDDLTLAVNAGEAELTGAANAVEVELNAGRADLTLADVSGADFEVSAGRLTAGLTGGAPDDVALDVRAGMLDVTLPEVAYDLSSDVSVGELDNQLAVSSASEHEVSATVAAGSATLRATEE